MTADGLIAQAGLDGLGIPVQIVQLKLDVLQLRVGGQDFVQHLGGVVEGEPGVPDAALRLLPGQELKGAQLPALLNPLGAEGVEPVVVKILHSAALQLLVKNFLQLFLPLYGPDRQLVGDGVALPGVTPDHRLPESLLALAAVVWVGGVEMGEPALQKAVRHPDYRREVDGAAVVGVQQGKAHQAKAQMFHKNSSC